MIDGFPISKVVHSPLYSLFAAGSTVQINVQNEAICIPLTREGRGDGTEIEGRI